MLVTEGCIILVVLCHIAVHAAPWVCWKFVSAFFYLSRTTHGRSDNLFSFLSHVQYGVLASSGASRLSPRRANLNCSGASFFERSLCMWKIHRSIKVVRRKKDRGMSLTATSRVLCNCRVAEEKNKSGPPSSLCPTTQGFLLRLQVAVFSFSFHSSPSLMSP